MAVKDVAENIFMSIAVAAASSAITEATDRVMADDFRQGGGELSIEFAESESEKRRS